MILKRLLLHHLERIVSTIGWVTAILLLANYPLYMLIARFIFGSTEKMDKSIDNIFTPYIPGRKVHGEEGKLLVGVWVMICFVIVYTEVRLVMWVLNSSRSSNPRAGPGNTCPSHDFNTVSFESAKQTSCA